MEEIGDLALMAGIPNGEDWRQKADLTLIYWWRKQLFKNDRAYERLFVAKNTDEIQWKK